MKLLAVVCVALFLALGTAQTTEEPGTKVATTAPTTKAKSTEAPTTKAKSTEAPTTKAKTTEPPTTKAKTTEAPTTKAKTTEAPTTKAKTTEAPTTKAKTTEAPTTKAHTTVAPTTAPPPTLWSVTDKTGKKCLLAEFDLTFTGTYEFVNKSKGDFVFPLPSNSVVDPDNSHCGTPTEPAVIVLTFDGNDKFALEFEMDSNTNMFELTSANASLVHDEAHFPDSGDAGKTVKYGGVVEKGTFKAEVGKCFRCFSMDKLNFKTNDFASTFRRLRVQPFEVEGGKFGEDSPCAADEAPSHWFVKDSHGAYCLLADFNVTFTGTYKTTKKTTEKFSFYMPPNAIVGAQSKCGDPGKSNAVLALTFDNGDTFIQEFSADTKKKTFQLHSAVAMLTHDPAHFPDSADQGKKVTYGGNTTNPQFGTSLGSYYKCSSNEKVDVGSKDDFALIYANLKVQPFDVDKKYGKMNQCALDTPTVRPAEPPMGKWNVSNTKGICMLMDFGADFIISYTMANSKNAKVGYYLPVDALKQKSKCDDKTATLVLDFEPGQTKPVKPWEMVMKFTMESNNYAMTNFSMMYYLDKEHFPGINETLSGTKKLYSNHTKRFNTVSGSYYFCNTDQDVYVTNVVTTFHNLTIQPFTQAVKGGGLGSPSDCAADNQVSNIVPIAVGCALAGLVIIVLIAYLIGRSRTNRAGYQSV